MLVIGTKMSSKVFILPPLLQNNDKYSQHIPLKNFVIVRYWLLKYM